MNSRPVILRKHRTSRKKNDERGDRSAINTVKSSNYSTKVNELHTAAREVQYRQAIKIDSEVSTLLISCLWRHHTRNSYAPPSHLFTRGKNENTRNKWIRWPSKDKICNNHFPGVSPCARFEAVIYTRYFALSRAFTWSAWFPLRRSRRRGRRYRWRKG